MDEPSRAPAGAAPAAASAPRGAPAAPRAGPLAAPVSRGLLAGVALVLALVAGVAWYEGRRSQQDMRIEVAKRLTATDASVAQLKAREAEVGGALRDTEAKLALLEARIAESQSQQASLEALYRELAPSRDELALNEVEQVLLLAGQQLAIAGNVQAALAALQLADAKLVRVDRAQLVPLRRALARDIDRLKAVPYVDVAGMSLKLDQVLSSIDSLPLARDERLPQAAPTLPAEDEAPWRRFLREAWSEVKALVRVEVSDRPAAPLVPPAQTFFLRENLRLRLLAARIALLSHDDAGFKTDVAVANAWIKQYFDTRTKTVQSISATLTQLAATPMPSDLPDLAGSLTALRALKATRDRAGDKPGATPGR
jgi:uroporphyrin-3 C-methyltransferase